LYLRQTTEAHADALHDLIFAAEILDAQPDDDENLFDEPVQMKHNPNEFSAQLDGCGNDDDLPAFAMGR
jgi:hypothetical protein